MNKLTPKDWGVLAVLGGMFVVLLTAKHFGYVEAMHQPLKREPIQTIPWNDGGNDEGKSLSPVLSRDYDPIRPRMRI